MALLTGTHSRRARAAAALEAIAAGEIRVVRRHARAVSGRIDSPRLALVIIDEQHRFGVQQRLQLAEKGQGPGRCRISSS